MATSSKWVDPGVQHLVSNFSNDIDKLSKSADDTKLEEVDEKTNGRTSVQRNLVKPED